MCRYNLDNIHHYMQQWVDKCLCKYAFGIWIAPWISRGKGCAFQHLHTQAYFVQKQLGSNLEPDNFFCLAFSHFVVLSVSVVLYSIRIDTAQQFLRQQEGSNLFFAKLVGSGTCYLKVDWFPETHGIHTSGATGRHISGTISITKFCASLRYIFFVLISTFLEK